MSGPEIKATVADVRRFLRRAHALDAPLDGVGAALRRFGYIQIDPLNICGRMHDLILRNRVSAYQEGGLMRHLHGAEDAPCAPALRTGFEHHLPGKNILVAFAHDAWPHLLGEMEARARRPGSWSGKLTAREKEFAPALLAELKARGPLSSEDLHDGRRSYRGWGASTLAKTTLQKLFFHGRVLIAARKSQRRYYALPEQVLSPAVLEQPRASAKETARWLILLKLRQHRLVKLSKAEHAMVDDAVASVAVRDADLKLVCLREDVPLFDGAGTGEARTPTFAQLLAPLDPMIYQRKLTAALWDFSYKWEVYTPAHKRVRGYYALPVLAGTEFIGHIDPKIDREAGRLLVQNREIRRGYAAQAEVALQHLARFLGLAG